MGQILPIFLFTCTGSFDMDRTVYHFPGIQFSRHLRSIFIRSVTYLFLEQSGKMLRVLKTEIIGDFINGFVCRCKFRLGYFNRLVMKEMQGG